MNELSWVSPGVWLMFAIFAGVVAVIIGTLWSERRDAYMQYVPKTSMVITKAEWARVEKNIAIEITKANSAGIRLGRNQIIGAVEDGIREKKGGRRTAYAVLGIKVGDEAKLEEKVAHLLLMYDPKNFEYLDNEFIELAELRTKEINDASSTILKFRMAAVGGRPK